ncbi:MAG: WD40 repeat domain-containing protein [Desulfovibrionaceae bacterium]|nr:WD40 repeat domain-containing protein [Desulfovibrionaceae bacterium]MBF0514914.1 WD40 repeat domain-containing protein [Desulfovibrionaceae bacterium]
MPGKTVLAAVFALVAALGGAAWAGNEDAYPEARTVVQRGHNSMIQSMAFSPDGRLLASLDTYDVIKVWTMPERCLVQTIRFKETAGGLGFRWRDKWDRLAERLGFTRDSTLVVQAEQAQVSVDPVSGKTLSVTRHAGYGLAYNGQIAVWTDQNAQGPLLVVAEATSGDRLIRSLPGTLKALDHLAVRPDGRFAAMADDNSVSLRDALSGHVLTTLTRPGGTPPWPIDAWNTPFGFDQNGKRVIDGNGVATLPKGPFQPATPGQIADSNPGFLPTNGPGSALDSTRGRIFLAHTPDGEIEMWDLRRNAPALRLYPYPKGGIWLTEDGYFDIQGKVPDVVRFVRGAACAGDGELFAARNKPERVREALQGRSGRPADAQ